MNQEEGNTLIATMRPTVEILAFQTYPKIKKPTHLSVDDLIQEGLMVCYEWVKRWYKSDSGASIKTFATSGVKFHFKDLVMKSWKSVNTIASVANEDEENTSFIDSFPGNTRTEVLNTIINLSSFSIREQQYIALILDPIDIIKNEIVNHPRQLRQSIRNFLTISIDTENVLRKQIQLKLETLNEQN